MTGSFRIAKNNIITATHASNANRMLRCVNFIFSNANFLKIMRINKEFAFLRGGFVTSKKLAKAKTNTENGRSYGIVAVVMALVAAVSATLAASSDAVHVRNVWKTRRGGQQSPATCCLQHAVRREGIRLVDRSCRIFISQRITNVALNQKIVLFSSYSIL